MINVLAIDPGTACGWAMRSEGLITSGTWSLKPNRHEGGGMRFLRFRRAFLEALKLGTVHEVYYEEVARHAGTDAAHIYGGFVAQLSEVCEEKGIPYAGIPVGTIKKHAAGNGHSSKEIMVATARNRWPDQKITDDNQADALWLLDYALEVKVVVG